MSSFVIAFLFAIGQVMLTEQMIKSYENKEKIKTGVFFGAKFTAYGIGIALVIFKYIWDFLSVFCGFIAGAPIAIIGLFLYKKIYRKKK